MMDQTADFVVIGGGCAGTSIAYHLASQRAGRVTLLERHTLASGTTGFSSAIVRQHYTVPVVARMAQRSLRVFQHFGEAIGGESGFRQTGLLVGARAQDLDHLRETVAMHHELGIDSRMIDLEQLQELEPRMSTTDLVAACYEPEAGYADPVATTQSFGRRARELGAQVREHSPVHSLLVQGDRVRGVRLQDGTQIEAPTVVVAANNWGVVLLRAVGVDLPVHPSRHACVLIQQPDGFGGQHPILLDMTNGLYLRPEGTDLTLAGTLDEPENEEPVDPDRYNAVPTHAEEADIAARICRRFPALQEGTVQSGWAGIYDISADWQPILSAIPGISGLFCALGFSGHGFKLSPVVGEMMANLMVGRSTEGIDMEIFRAERFVGGALAHSTYAFGIIG